MWTVYDCVSFPANVPSLPKLVRILRWGSYFGGLNLNSKPNTFCMYLLQEISPQASAKGWRISAKLVIFASFLQSKFLKAGKVKKKQQLIVLTKSFHQHWTSFGFIFPLTTLIAADAFSCLLAPRLRRTEPLGTEGSSGSNHMTLPRPPLGQKRSINHQQSVRFFTSNHPVESVPTVPTGFNQRHFPR